MQSKFDMIDIVFVCGFVCICENEYIIWLAHMPYMHINLYINREIMKIPLDRNVCVCACAHV